MTSRSRGVSVHARQTRRSPRSIWRALAVAHDSVSRSMLGFPAWLDGSSRAAFVQAAVASAVHRFDDARDHLRRAALLGGPFEKIERHSLTIDQACGVNLDAVLASRKRITAVSSRLEDLVPIGAVLVDLERFAEADNVYRQAFYAYDGMSPFPLARVCFQLAANADGATVQAQEAPRTTRPSRSLFVSSVT